MRRILETLSIILLVLSFAFVFGYVGYSMHQEGEGGTKEAPQAAAINTSRAEKAAPERVPASAVPPLTEEPPVTEKEADGPVTPKPSEEAVFSKCTEAYWENITAAQMQTLAEELSLLISRDLGLHEVPTIVLIYSTEVSFTGSYQGIGIIKINLYELYKDAVTLKMEVCDYFVEILAHEHRHAWQYQRVKEDYDTALERSYKSYISPEEDYNAYYNQLVERDARLYGAYYADYIEEMRLGTE